MDSREYPISDPFADKKGDRRTNSELCNASLWRSLVQKVLPLNPCIIIFSSMLATLEPELSLNETHHFSGLISLSAPTPSCCHGIAWSSHSHVGPLSPVPAGLILSLKESEKK